MSNLSRILRVFLGWSAVSILPVSAATFDVSQSLWGDASTPNSFAWAIHQANTTSGADVIRLLNDVVVDGAPITNVSGFLTELTDTAGVTIHGNGHALVGNPLFTTLQGDLVDKKFPRPYRSSTDSLLIPAYSFARIANNISHVTVDGLVIDGLNAFLDVGEGSVATITDSTIRYAVS